MTPQRLYDFLQSTWTKSVKSQQLRTETIEAENLREIKLRSQILVQARVTDEIEGIRVRRETAFSTVDSAATELDGLDAAIEVIETEKRGFEEQLSYRSMNHLDERAKLELAESRLALQTKAREGLAKAHLEVGRLKAKRSVLAHKLERAQANLDEIKTELAAKHLELNEIDKRIRELRST